MESATAFTHDRGSDTVALLVSDAANRLLVFWHAKYRFWTVPLGKVESWEEDVVAARREALEELGIVSEHIELIERIYKPAAIDDYSDIVIALCRVDPYSGTIENREPEKHHRLRFIHPHDLNALTPLSFPTQVIADRFNGVRATGRVWRPAGVPSG